MKEFIKVFNKLTMRHSTGFIWDDFIDMSAYAISNAVDREKEVYESREAAYLRIASNYTKEELDNFAHLLALVVDAYEKNPAQDYLGTLFMQLNLGNGRLGQVFTPWHIADLMSQINFDDELEKRMNNMGYITINDPCCGGGVMLIAFANMLKTRGINFQQKVVFVGQDIDPTAAKMCYIQMSLLGCPGYVVIGNSLTQPSTGHVLYPQTDKQRTYYTPLWFHDTWVYRRASAQLETLFKQELEKPKTYGALPSKQLKLSVAGRKQPIYVN